MKTGRVVSIGGRHTRGKGYERDCEKYNEAVILGWRILRVTTDMVSDGRAFDVVARALHQLRQERDGAIHGNLDSGGKAGHA